MRIGNMSWTRYEQDQYSEVSMTLLLSVKVPKQRLPGLQRANRWGAVSRAARAFQRRHNAFAVLRFTDNTFFHVADTDSDRARNAESCSFPRCRHFTFRSGWYIHIIYFSRLNTALWVILLVFAIRAQAIHYGLCS
jgi:hypothetical protein